MEAREEPMMQHNFSISNVSRPAWCTVRMVATLVMFLAACGSNTSSSGSEGTTPTSSGSGYGSGRYGSGGTTPTASSTGSLIKTATATVNGTSQTILTNASGLTPTRRVRLGHTYECNVPARDVDHRSGRQWQPGRVQRPPALHLFR